MIRVWLVSALALPGSSCSAATSAAIGGRADARWSLPDRQRLTESRHFLLARARLNDAARTWQADDRAQLKSRARKDRFELLACALQPARGDEHVEVTEL